MCCNGFNPFLQLFSITPLMDSIRNAQQHGWTTPANIWRVDHTVADKFDNHDWLISSSSCVFRCKKTVSPPKYLSDDAALTYHFYGSSKHDGEEEVTATLSADDHAEIPSAKELRMNSSQHSAFVAALTQEFSVIQGMSATCSRSEEFE